MEFSRVSWLMERRLSDKIFVTKLNVRSTEELFDPDMLTIKEASRHRLGNSLRSTEQQREPYGSLDWTHVRGKNCTNNKHLLKTMNNDFVIDVLTNTVALWNLKPCDLLGSRKCGWNVFIFPINNGSSNHY